MYQAVNYYNSLISKKITLNSLFSFYINKKYKASRLKCEILNCNKFIVQHYFRSNLRNFRTFFSHDSHTNSRFWGFVERISGCLSLIFSRICLSLAKNVNKSNSTKCPEYLNRHVWTHKRIFTNQYLSLRI